MHDLKNEILGKFFYILYIDSNFGIIYNLGKSGDKKDKKRDKKERKEASVSDSDG